MAPISSIPRNSRISMLASSLQEPLAGPFIPQTTPKLQTTLEQLPFSQKPSISQFLLKGQLTTYIISVWGCQKTWYYLWWVNNLFIMKGHPKFTINLHGSLLESLGRSEDITIIRVTFLARVRRHWHLRAHPR